MQQVNTHGLDKTDSGSSSGSAIQELCDLGKLHNLHKLENGDNNTYLRDYSFSLQAFIEHGARSGDTVVRFK